MAVREAYVYHRDNSGGETEVLMEIPSALEGHRAIFLLPLELRRSGPTAGSRLGTDKTTEEVSYGQEAKWARLPEFG